MPTTEDKDSWEAHQRASKDEYGEPWTGNVLAAVMIVATVVSACGTLWWFLQ
jgi:hypothetical protein